MSVWITGETNQMQKMYVSLQLLHSEQVILDIWLVSVLETVIEWNPQGTEMKYHAVRGLQMA